MRTVTCNGTCHPAKTKTVPAGPLAWILYTVIGVVIIIRISYRWFSGAPMRRSVKTRKELLSRPLRTLIRYVITTVAVGTVVDWAVTFWTLIAVDAALVVVVVVRARRAARVHATIDGTSVAATLEARPAQARPEPELAEGAVDA